MKNLSRAKLKSVTEIAFFILLLFSPFFVRAANPLDVAINEIAWMGTKVEGIESKNWWRYEWLELYNNTNQPISLNGWKIELYRTELDWALELKGSVPAQSYFLIVASDKISSNFDLNYSNLGGKFINSGQKVVLKDSQGNIIDLIDCFSYEKWFAGDNSTKQTMERKNPQVSGNNFDNWATSQNPGGTPKAENSTTVQVKPIEEPVTEPEPPKPQPTEEPQPQSKLVPKEEPITYPSGVLLNEILPSPEGPDSEEEWIEIFNQNGFEVDLSGWKIQDTAGKTTSYIFPKEIKISAKGFLVLSRPTTKITLNNDGDGLNLIQPDGKIIDQVSYQKAPKGESYNRTEDGWLWSSTLTPGSENIIPSKISEKEEKTPKTTDEKGLAAIGPVTKILKSEKWLEKGVPKSLIISLTALGIAIFSGIIILILKRTLNRSSKKIE